MKILFLCNSYPENLRSELTRLSKVGLNNAVNTFQSAIISGLFENNADFEVQCFPSLGTFPLKFKKTFVPGGEYLFEGKKIGYSNSYCAIPLFKDFSISNKIFRLVREHVENSSEDIIVVTYNIESFVLSPLIKLKKHFPHLQICSIVTDLIDEYFNPIYHRSIFKTIQGKRELKAVHRAYPYIDKFILLSKSMEEKIPQAVEHNIVVEGIHLGKSVTPTPIRTNQKTLLYTGALAAHACIKDLVDSFMMTTNTDYRLVICGDGELSSYVLEKATIDKRIKYMGLVSREKAVRLQQEATVVINPRKPSISLTKYSFPSKTMEYLASGTPMIGYKLIGIPDEYYKYMFTVDGLDNSDLARTIEYVFSLDENVLKVRAIQASEFIRDYKNSKIQVKKILDFID